MVNVSKDLEKIQSINTEKMLVRASDADIYALANFEEIRDQIQTTIDKSKEADFTEEDRAQIKAMRAFVNKFIKSIDRSVIDERSRMFDPVDEQRKELAKLMRELNATLNESLDQFDARVREERRQELIVVFEDSVFLRTSDDDNQSYLSELTLASIEAASWYNRSASKNKSINELNERIESVVALTQVMSGLKDDVDVTDVVDILHEEDWNVASAINTAIAMKAEEDRLAAEAKAAEEKRLKELAEAEERGRLKAEQEAKERAEREERARLEAAKAKREKAKAEAEAKSIVSKKVNVTVEVAIPEGEDVTRVAHYLNELLQGTTITDLNADILNVTNA